MPMPFTYDEPTVIWRMHRGEGASTHAVIGPEGAGAWVMWFVNGRPMGVRDFSDWSGALAMVRADARPELDRRLAYRARQRRCLPTTKPVLIRPMWRD